MAERALRGSRLGAVSYENDHATEFAERRRVAYRCANAHHFEVPFSVEAEIPNAWECRYCGAVAARESGPAPAANRPKPARTHWDMLLERRSIPELEAILDERLEVLRRQRKRSA